MNIPMTLIVDEDGPRLVTNLIPGFHFPVADWLAAEILKRLESLEVKFATDSNFTLAQIRAKADEYKEYKTVQALAKLPTRDNRLNLDKAVEKVAWEMAISELARENSEK